MEKVPSIHLILEKNKPIKIKKNELQYYLFFNINKIKEEKKSKVREKRLILMNVYK